LKELVNKRVFLIYGNAGVGKSTLASAFIRGTKHMISDNGKYYPSEVIMYKHKEMFTVKHLNERNNKTGEFFPFDEQNDLYLVEYPNPTDKKM